ncbi:hydroxypyruvate isomerase [Caldalkalibacillus uzonensis]|uniref:Hydroxypyruvate isomerase n=1 Tax=Caldalkalibacillus uzonensis TaxID=353224 RepID=A0ABU0CNW8_9BACI|nr:hydroxypyruvate isomerase [Caldalkalibacillus uzonensis]
MNALIGHEIPGINREEQLELARKNLGFAADQARKFGIEVLVEAVNTFENGPYLLSTTRQAVDLIDSVGRDNLKLQYDVYHMQRMEGNIVYTIQHYLSYIAHVQIADSPNRGEPGTGEINYRYVLSVLKESGYKGYIGLEYNPSARITETSLVWLPRSLRGGEVDLADIRDLKLERRI